MSEIVFLVPGHSASVVQDYFPRMGEELAGRARSVSYRDLLGQADLSPGVYVFTGLNRLGPKSREALSALHAQMAERPGFRTLNHPLHTLGRYELLQALFREGLNDFRAFGAWEELADLRFPAFVRHRSRDGGVPRLLSTRRAVDTEIGQLLMDGAAISDILVIEYLDTSDSQGFYRKFSAYAIGSRIIPVTMDFGNNWVLRRNTAQFRRETVEEEREFTLTNPHEEQLRRIFRVSGTQFGRIDYSILEGRIQTWEINTLPLLRRPPGAKPEPEELKPIREKNYREFGARYAEAWRELLDGVAGTDPLPIRLDPGTLMAGRQELSGARPATDPGPERLSGIRRVLRPLKPLIKPLVFSLVYPRIARSARKAAREGASIKES